MTRTILTNEQKKEIMKRMKTDVKADFVDVIMETIKKRNNRRKLNGNTKSN
jgi:hypothetical protein